MTEPETTARPFPATSSASTGVFDDPASAEGDEVARRRVFRQVRGEIAERLRHWVTVQRKRLRDQGLLADVESPGL